MSCKCNKKTCPKCNPNDIADLKALVSELSDNLSQVSKATSFLTNGHPILLVEFADDVASFDLTSGAGSGNWTGWALCTGKTFKSTQGKSIKTPNFTDRFIVMAGGEYLVDAIGGADLVSLTTPQLPAHNHPIIDNGHNHTVPPHVHTTAPHAHFTDPHTHTYKDAAFASPIVGGFGVTTGGTTIGTSDFGRTTDATGVTVDPATVVVNQTALTTDVDPANIATDNTGNGQSHENRPPYWAAFYIMYIG